MGISLTVARGSLRRRPGRAIFSVLGVAVGDDGADSVALRVGPTGFVLEGSF